MYTVEIEQPVFTMDDGHKIQAMVYKPENLPIGHIHLLHGMAEHQLRYKDFARQLVEVGYLVTSHDHRGHGETAVLNNATIGYYADKDGFERVVTDVYEVLTAIQVQHGELPLTLFGHSMGSFIARRYAQRYSETLHSAIFCATGDTTPLHVIGNKIAKMLVKVNGAKTPSRIMNRLSFGSFNNGIKNVVTNFDWICSDENVVQKYIEDTHCGFIATNQFFVDLTGGLITINKQAEIDKIRKDLPVLFISGVDDPVGEQGKGVYKVAEQLIAANMTEVAVSLFEGMRHEIINEKNKQHVYDVVLRWLKKYE